MTQDHELEQAIAELKASTDPTTLMRQLIVDGCGDWPDENPAALFEVQYCGVVGAGIGIPAAVENWLVNAEALQFRVDTAA